MRPSITRRDLETRIDRLLDELNARQANLGVTSGRHAIDEAGRRPRNARHRRARARPVPCPRSRRPALLRTHDRTPAGRARRHPLMLDSASKGLFHLLALITPFKTLASRYGMRQPSSFARRFIAGETTEGSHRRRARGGGTRPADHAGPSRRERRHHRARRRRHARILRGRASRSSTAASAGTSHSSSRSSGSTVDRATCVDNLRRVLERAEPAGFFIRHRHGGLGAHRGDARHLRNAVGPRPPSDGRRAAGGPLSNRGGSAASPQARRARPAREGRVQGAEDRRVSDTSRTSTRRMRG